MKVVGLTGGYASGKSLVANFFAERGAKIVDSDLIARQVVAPGSPGLVWVIEAFGEEFLTPGGELDRKKLGKLVFSDEAERKKLEAILHPLIRLENITAIASAREERGRAPLVVMAPLLFETGLEKMVDVTVVVTCRPDQQAERGAKRDQITLEEAKARIASQQPLAEKGARANYRIDNSGSPESTMAQAGKIWATMAD